MREINIYMSPSDEIAASTKSQLWFHEATLWQKHSQIDIYINIRAGQPFLEGLVYPLATVNDDILRSDSSFQHAHLWMVTPTSEEAGRLDAEVPDPLLVIVHDAETVLLQDSLILLFDFLQRCFQYKNVIIP